MTTPNQNRAGQYLQRMLDTFSDDMPPEKSLEIFTECSELADQDFAECLTNEHKQKVWAALVNATNILIRSHGGNASASNALLQALTNAALNRQGSQDLRSRISPTTKPLSAEWVRACIIALIEKYPDLLDQTMKDASDHLGIGINQISKLHENYKTGQTGGRTLPNLVQTAKSMIEEFEYKTLKELI